MSTGRLIIDLDAVVANWRALDAMTNCKTAAVVKADGYGLGSVNVAKALFKSGVRQFFVAVAEEAAPIRQELGPKPEINVFSGHMKGDTNLIRGMAYEDFERRCGETRGYKNSRHCSYHPLGETLLAMS